MIPPLNVVFQVLHCPQQTIKYRKVKPSQINFSGIKKACQAEHMQYEVIE